MSFSKSGILLLIATRMSAYAFKRFLDFVLIDVMNSYDDKQKSFCYFLHSQSRKADLHVSSN